MKRVFAEELESGMVIARTIVGQWRSLEYA